MAELICDHADSRSCNPHVNVSTFHFSPFRLSYKFLPHSNLMCCVSKKSYSVSAQFRQTHVKILTSYHSLTYTKLFTFSFLREDYMIPSKQNRISRDKLNPRKIMNSSFSFCLYFSVLFIASLVCWAPNLHFTCI